MPKVNLYATLRELVGRSQVEVPGKTVGEVVQNLLALHPALAPEILEEGQLAERVSLFLDGRDIRYLQGLGTPLEEGAVLDLFPPVAGGA